MPKKSHFICQECGDISQKWAGKCSACGAWDSIVEEEISAAPGVPKSNKGKKREFESLQGEATDVLRTSTGIEELDRVLGGGLVAASAILIGGDPGIGKSTLVLQLLAQIAGQGRKVAYISGEESSDQIRLRAKRLGLEKAEVSLLACTSVSDIIETISGQQKPEVLVIDSVQTMYNEDIASAPGTVSQVKSATYRLIHYAKTHNITLLLIGHVTKEGQIAGPKLLEHMVDTVLYFEGERGHAFRLLRAVKNRYGAANEIGVFQMRDKGLMEVKNPSALFLSDQEQQATGMTVFAAMEGTRPVLVEVQALVAQTTMPTPRRAVVGWDQSRLSMMLAILHTRYGIFLGDKEVYLNVAGGFKVTEPAADLAVITALISAITHIPVPRKAVIFGEVGLSGEVRMVSHSDIRIKEASKLGFESAIAPKGTSQQNNSFILEEIKNIKELQRFFEAGALQNAS